MPFFQCRVRGLDHKVFICTHTAIFHPGHLCGHKKNFPKWAGNVDRSCIGPCVQCTATAFIFIARGKLVNYCNKDGPTWGHIYHIQPPPVGGKSYPCRVATRPPQLQLFHAGKTGEHRYLYIIRGGWLGVY